MKCRDCGAELEYDVPGKELYYSCPAGCDEKKEAAHEGDPNCKECHGTGKLPLSDDPEMKHGHIVCACTPEQVDRLRKKKERLADSITCIKHKDPETFKASWSLWSDGSEILRVDPQALRHLSEAYGDGTLPSELAAFIAWMEQLSKKREQTPSEIFTGNAALARKRVLDKV